MKKNWSFLIASLAISSMAVMSVACNDDDENENNQPSNNQSDPSNNQSDPNNGQEEPINKDGVDSNGHMYVDLGLPSGTLWATCNIGATKPEEFGDYLAWGESTEKLNLLYYGYSWMTYKYAKVNEAKEEIEYVTKYNLSASKGGVIDNLSTLTAEDDAATILWGDEWRMPTYEDFKELNSYCTYQWTWINHVGGAQFVAKNGKSIFLPAALCWSGMQPVDPSYYDGYYWTSTVDPKEEIYAHSFLFGQEKRDSHYFANTSRCIGLSVRAVRVNK